MSTVEPPPTKRSLLLAGGGMKVAFQAGVLQVLLSEAGLHFDHYDACSGGAFNLAMLCDGRTGIEIADAWRDTVPLDGVSARWQDLVRLPFRQRSILTLDAYRTKVFRRWGLDFDRIRASSLTATFTVHDRTRGERVTWTPQQMTPERMVACLAQALWFPPVTIDGTIYTDAVFDTDANVDAALAAGATEIWILWTVSRRPEWMPGVLAQFFHALEISANGTLTSDLARIEANNAEFDAGRVGPLGRKVDVHLLEAEVPVHYLFLVGQDRLHRAVERGVAEGRRWCRSNGHALTVEYDRGGHYDSDVALEFVDHLTGRLENKRAEANLRLLVDDAGEFVSAGRQRARLAGTVTCSLLEGEAEVVGGHADIFMDVMVPTDHGEVADPTRKRMEYVMHLETPTGRALTLTGLKVVADPSLRRAAREAMMLSCRLYEGFVEFDHPDPPLARGRLQMSWGDVARQVAYARAYGPDLRSELGGLGRYGMLFAGNFWDVCRRRWLTYAPF